MSSEVMTPMNPRADALPAWTSVLVVVAHPDDESFGLGAIIDAFARSGSSVDVLCLTQGEASTLHGAPGDLASLRGAELVAAADVLGVSRAIIDAFARSGSSVDVLCLTQGEASTLHGALVTSPRFGALSWWRLPMCSG